MTTTTATNGRATTVAGSLYYFFAPYDADLVARIRALPRRRWNAEDKVWTAPIRQAGLAEIIRDFGFTVYRTVSECREARAAFEAAQRAAIPADVETGVEALPGIYAIEASGTTTILRVSRDGFEDGDGIHILSLGLGGQYRGFAHVNPNGTLHAWRRRLEVGGETTPTEATRILFTAIEAAKILLAADTETRGAFGRAYALASGRCWRCNRTLTDEQSIERGIGPDCLKRVERVEQ